jgi:cellulose synthase/poly-beta-1,6-N-acetylglucosamine synthase-like glycosyltransferase
MPSAPAEWPRVDVIVAVHNEAPLIAGKLRELDAIDYPGDRLGFILVDGGSSDGTLAALLAHAAANPRFDVLPTALAGKPAQLNEALALAKAPWVLVTDADARLPAGMLKRLVVASRHDAGIGVVATPVRPHQAHPLDAWHWRISNFARQLERRVRGATGLAVGTCYLFRRDLIPRFPADAIADDVHVVYAAAGAGARTVLVDAVVTELRVAATTRGWFRHKVRRTLGYLREVFRFAPTVARMKGPMRGLLMWRGMALTVGPLAGLTLVLVLADLIGPWWSAGMTFTVAAAGSALPRRSKVAHALQGATMPLWILGITLTALVLYPFVRQSPSYTRPAASAARSEVLS